jgi:hypothetical protein
MAPWRCAGRIEGESVLPTCDLAKRYGALPLRTVVQHARLTRAFVRTVTSRWAAGEPVPHRCGKDWIFELACQAELAEMVAARRLIALSPLRPAPIVRRPVAYGQN